MDEPPEQWVGQFFFLVWWRRVAGGVAGLSVLAVGVAVLIFLGAAGIVAWEMHGCSSTNVGVVWCSCW